VAGDRLNLSAFWNLGHIIKENYSKQLNFSRRKSGVATKRLVIVQHMDWEVPGQHLLAALLAARVEFRVVEVWQEPLPALDSFDGMIVLGGSPNVDQEEEFPYLRPLKACIREVITAGKAYLGFCLGHQLLGHVLGCRVGPLAQKSVGFITGELTPAGMAHPVFQGLSAELSLFKWHGQGVLPSLPAGVSLLAKSAAVPVEALGLTDNPRVVGLQFDNHAASVDVANWLKHDGDWALTGSGADPEAMVVTAVAQEAVMGQQFRRFMENFLGLF
jgi:GMP synthase-like glutamine amidotransferase